MVLQYDNGSWGFDFVKVYPVYTNPTYSYGVGGLRAENKDRETNAHLHSPQVCVQTADVHIQSVVRVLRQSPLFVRHAQHEVDLTVDLVLHSNSEICSYTMRQTTRLRSNRRLTAIRFSIFCRQQQKNEMKNNGRSHTRTQTG